MHSSRINKMKIINLILSIYILLLLEIGYSKNNGSFNNNLESKTEYNNTKELIRLSKESIYYSPKVAESFANVAILISMRESSINLKGHALLNKAISCRAQSRYYEAIENCNSAINIFKTLTDSLMLSKAYCERANSMIYTNEYNLAYSSSMEALRINLKCNYKKEESHCYSIIGMIFNKIGNFGKAILYYNKAAEIYENYQVDYLNNPLIYLGDVYFELDSIKMSKETFEKALIVNKSIGQNNRLANTLNKAGDFYAEIGDMKKAVEYISEAKSISIIIKDNFNLSKSYNGLANIYEKSDQYELALEYNFKTLKIREIIGSQRNIASSHINISRIYEKRGIR